MRVCPEKAQLKKHVQFFCGNLIFFVFWWNKNIQLTHSFPMHSFRNSLTVFWCFQGLEKGCIGNKWVITVFWIDDALFGKLIITFITFIAIRNYYFSFDLTLLFCFVLFFIFTLFQINLRVIFIIFIFLFCIQSRLLFLPHKTEGKMDFYCRKNLILLLWDFNIPILSTINIAWKVSKYGVFLVLIFSHWD